jgi:hypothetical protein
MIVQYPVAAVVNENRLFWMEIAEKKTLILYSNLMSSNGEFIKLKYIAGYMEWVYKP